MNKNLKIEIENFILFNENINLLKKVILCGSDINKIDKYGNNICIYAACDRNPERLKYLLQNFDPNYQNNFGETALTYAIYNKNISIIHILLCFNININIPYINGETVLFDIIFLYKKSKNVWYLNLLIFIMKFYKINLYHKNNLNYDIFDIMNNKEITYNKFNNKLKEFVIENIKNSFQPKTYLLLEIKNNDICPICLDKIDILSYITPCEHNFHLSCFIKYIENIKDIKYVICPYCNKKNKIN